MNRKCSKCKIDKPLTLEFFGANSTARPNAPSQLFKYICKTCYPITEKTKDRARILKRKYNLTLDGYQQMVINQEEKCAICKTQCELCIDHNHTTGKVRGLLCNECNLGISRLKEDQEILVRAIHYLNLHNKGYE